MNAMRSAFPQAVQFLCDMHLRDNLTDQCRKLNVNKMLTSEIQSDVFGKRSGSLKTGKRRQ